eukprot:TRINITY_DN9267_c0_g1_i2.p1 TRINITY_DN9267_c0_g1~~TRINITY_DN9267_c0_g1_i2.p1  ORF type:complete len:143 (-),score=22.35 TRINITY_DN9267_c0_g1_i2:280-708(-)
MGCAMVADAKTPKCDQRVIVNSNVASPLLQHVSAQNKNEESWLVGEAPTVDLPCGDHAVSEVSVTKTESRPSVPEGCRTIGTGDDSDLVGTTPGGSKFLFPSTPIPVLLGRHEEASQCVRGENPTVDWCSSDPFLFGLNLWF